jgi:hypothetical protein
VTGADARAAAREVEAQPKQDGQPALKSKNHVKLSTIVVDRKSGWFRFAYRRLPPRLRPCAARRGDATRSGIGNFQTTMVQFSANCTEHGPVAVTTYSPGTR